MNRRLFFRDSLIAGAFFSAGYLIRGWLPKQEAELIEGEEWREDRTINKADLQNLPSDEKVFTEAKLNIEKYRKSSIEILLKNQEGLALKQVPINIQQIDQEMDWGYSSAGTFVSLSDSQKTKKSRNIAQLFNCTTAKCYWNERWHQPIEKYEGVRVYDLFLEEIAWAEAMGLRVKGHPLIWTVDKAIPRWFFKYTYEDQLKILKNHIQSLVELGGQRVTRWDLCNEMLWEPALKNIAQRDWPHIDPISAIAEYISQGITWAKEINPNAIYSLNDYGLVLTYVKKISASEQRKRYIQLIQELRQRKTLPDAIGSQAHIGGRFPLGAFARMIDDLSQSQLPVQITEFWTRPKDYPEMKDEKALQEAMAIYLEKIYTLAFSKPSVNHFTFWGGDKIFFSKDGNPLPCYERLYDLIKNQWTTNLKLTTDNEGKIQFRGFKGNYSLSINQKTIQQKISQAEEKFEIEI